MIVLARIIPRKLIRHLEWEPGKEPPKREEPEPPRYTSPIDIDRVVNGKTFYDANLPAALEQALAHGNGMVVATLPELIAAKIQVDKDDHPFWQDWYTTLTEENVGIDEDGLFGAKDKPVLITLHGGGLLLPERIRKAYEDGLTDQHAAIYTPEEFYSMLKGELPSGSIPLYHFDDFKIKGELPRQYGVVMDLEMAKATNSGYHQRDAFIANPLVIARSGGEEHVEAYYEKAKHSDGDLGNWHLFDKIDPNTPQGRLLCFGDYDGLDGGLLDFGGRFIGVAPETHAARR